MYESHYGFKAKPFSIVPNPNIIFLNKNYQNALSYMKYGLKEKVGFILLTGEIGAGKTTLIRYMLGAIEDRVDFAVIFNTNFSSDQLFRLILSEFEIPSDSMEKERQLELFYQFLIDRYANRRHVLLIIDEAQNLTDDALEDIRMLSNLQTNEQILLQIMLVGQPELKKRLASPGFRQLAQRIAVSYHLPPLTEDQTCRYVAYRIEAVGGPPDLFTPEAVKLIHDSSGGIPRTINLLCDAALVYGYADDLLRIGKDTVELVLTDQICILNPNCHANRAEPSSRIESPIETDDLRSRMSLVERTVSKLQWRVDELSREMKNELLFKYQELLTSERDKYDQLKKDYDQLFQEHTRVLGQAGWNTQNTVKAPKIVPHHQHAADITFDRKVNSAFMHRIKIWRKKHHKGSMNYANDEDFTPIHAYKKFFFGNCIARFNPLEKLSSLWSDFLLICNSFSAKTRKTYDHFRMPGIKIPAVMRWVDGIKATRRMSLRWLFWSVVLLIPISIISVFFITKQPMTANVPTAKQFEGRAEAGFDTGSRKERERAAPVISEETIVAEPQKPKKNAVDAAVEKKTPLRHTVQSGDTLTSIAREYKTSVDAIIRENALQNNLIYIGQTLRIPFYGAEESVRKAG